MPPADRARARRGPAAPPWLARPVLWLLAVMLLTACVAAGAGAVPAGFDRPDPAALNPRTDSSPTELCNLWNAIGDTPTDGELDAAAGRYGVVILNPWETDALARLRSVAPDVTVLVYKDFSSTRSYLGTVTNGRDASILPTGVGYVEADQEHPEWFATDTAGERIEWANYPAHWQMAVWDAGYRQRWTDSVVSEVVDAGWDGVFADNDFASLQFYSPAVLAGTAGAAETDQLIRDGLDALVADAGTALQDEGKLLVPNISEARLFPGRWEEHGRFGGGMEEHFAYFDSDTGGEFLTDSDPTGWLVQTAQVDQPDRLSLAITRAAPDDLQAQRYGYASAAVRGAGRVCWTVNTVGAYNAPEWTVYQDVDLGEAIGRGVRAESGAWTREFEGGWVAVNPTTSTVRVVPPRGMGGGPVDVPPTDALIRGRE